MLGDWRGGSVGGWTDGWCLTKQSLNPSQEACGWVGGVPFFLALWHQIEREERDVRSMSLLEGPAVPPQASTASTAAATTPGSNSGAAGYPSVDVFVVCYSEPLAVIEPTVVAALNLSWPGKLAVYVCDDGRKEAVKTMVATLNADMKWVSLGLLLVVYGSIRCHQQLWKQGSELPVSDACPPLTKRPHFYTDSILLQGAVPRWLRPLPPLRHPREGQGCAAPRQER
jgi:hypothetical protein